MMVAQKLRSGVVVRGAAWSGIRLLDRRVTASEVRSLSRLRGGLGWGRHSGTAGLVRQPPSRLLRTRKPRATAYRSGTPTPALPRKRERERSGASVDMIVAWK